MFCGLAGRPRPLAARVLLVIALACQSRGLPGRAAAQELLAATRDFPGITDALAVAALDVRLGARRVCYIKILPHTLCSSCFAWLSRPLRGT